MHSLRLNGATVHRQVLRVTMVVKKCRRQGFISGFVTREILIGGAVKAIEQRGVRLRLYICLSKVNEAVAKMPPKKAVGLCRYV